MTKEEKDILLKDLFARLPYDLIVQETFQKAKGNRHVWDCGPYYIKDHPEKVKPYLRKLSSMTEEEKKEFNEKFDVSININEICGSIIEWTITTSCDFEDVSLDVDTINLISDWFDKKMFDWRRIKKDNKLISMIKAGLALEAPEGMYNF